jgi:hypothetical protein
MATQLKEVVINIDGGVMGFIYDDELAELTGEGVTSIRRVSHVEPMDPSNKEGDIGWEADMGPVNGPVLGPYATRGKALEAEVSWLKTNKGL